MSIFGQKQRHAIASGCSALSHQKREGAGLWWFAETCIILPRSFRAVTLIENFIAGDSFKISNDNFKI
jgi:hypothetical protein